MPKVRLDLPDKTFDALTRLAVKERRPIDWQAEVLIEAGLGIRNQPSNGSLPPHNQDINQTTEGREAMRDVA